MYNNATERHEELGWELEHAAWFEDSDGLLYIIPPPDVTADSISPDNDIADDLGGCAWVGLNQVAKRHKLLEIPRVLRRFNPSDGFYHS